MISFTFKLLYIWLLRLISQQHAEDSLRKWVIELDRKIWSRHQPNMKGRELDVTGQAVVWQVGGDEKTAAKKIQTAISEWETMPYETDSIQTMTDHRTRKSPTEK